MAKSYITIVAKGFSLLVLAVSALSFGVNLSEFNATGLFGSSITTIQAWIALGYIDQYEFAERVRNART